MIFVQNGEIYHCPGTVWRDTEWTLRRKKTIQQTGMTGAGVTVDATMNFFSQPEEEENA